MQLRTQHTGSKMGTIFPWENLLYASLSLILLQGLSYPDFSVHEHFLCLFVNIIQLESHASVYFCVQLFFLHPVIGLRDLVLSLPVVVVCPISCCTGWHCVASEHLRTWSYQSQGYCGLC